MKRLSEEQIKEFINELKNSDNKDKAELGETLNDLMDLVDKVEVLKTKEKEIKDLEAQVELLETIIDGLSDTKKSQLYDILDESTHLIFGVYAKEMDLGTAIGFGIYPELKEQSSKTQLQVLTNLREQVDMLIEKAEKGELTLDADMSEFGNDCTTCDKVECEQHPLYNGDKSSKNCKVC